MYQLKSIFLLFIVLLVSCGQNRPPVAVYTAEINSKSAYPILNYLKEFATDEGLYVVEKKRSVMRNLSDGEDAFGAFFYVNENSRTSQPVMFVSNAGASQVLSVSLYEAESFDRKKALELGMTVRAELNRRFGIELKPK